MKKVFRIGLLVFALANLLAISAFAASGVEETGASLNWSYTATFDGTDSPLKAGDMYLIIVIKTSALTDGGFPASLTADAILYIDQTTVATSDVSNGYITFTGFIPMNYVGGKAFITGGTLTAPALLGILPGHGILGDVNNSNTVTATDAKWILQKTVGMRTFDATQTFLGDVNNSGSVTATDARWILQFLVGLRNSDFTPKS